MSIIQTINQLKEKNILLIIIITALVVFGHSLFNDFVWDDEEQVVNNIAIQKVSNIPSFFFGSTFNSGGATMLSGLYYKPLLTTTYTLIYSLFKLRPLFYHAVQILIHVVNTYLLFKLYLETTKNKTPALLASLIFLIHPFNVESVVYIAGLQEPLFFLFGILAFQKIRQFSWKKNYNQKTNLILLNLLLLLSLLSKETGIIFFLIVNIYSFLFFKKNKLSVFLTSIITFCLYLFLRIGLAGIGLNKHGLAPISIVSLSGRLLTMPKIILFYFKNFFFPSKLAISHHWMVTSATFQDFYLPLILSSALTILLVLLTFKFKSSNKKHNLYKILFLISFIVSLVFHSQIFPLDMTVSDRWFYLPMAGLLGLLAICFKQLWDKFQKKKLLMVYALFSIIAVFSIQTYIRSRHWKNSLTIYSHDIKINPLSFDLTNNYGVALFRINQIPLAKDQFFKSAQLAPQWWTNWNNLGVCIEQEGDLETALSYYRKAINNGRYYLAYENYAKVLIKQNKLEEAKNFLHSEALLYFPNNQRLREIDKYINQQLQ